MNWKVVATSVAVVGAVVSSGPAASAASNTAGPAVSAPQIRDVFAHTLSIVIVPAGHGTYKVGSATVQAAAHPQGCYTSHNFVKGYEGPLKVLEYHRYWNWCTDLVTDRMTYTPKVSNTHAESYGWVFGGVDKYDGWQGGSYPYVYVGDVNVHWTYPFKIGIGHSATLIDNIYWSGADKMNVRCC